MFAQVVCINDSLTVYEFDLRIVDVFAASWDDVEQDDQKREEVEIEWVVSQLHKLVVRKQNLVEEFALTEFNLVVNSFGRPIFAINTFSQLKKRHIGNSSEKNVVNLSYDLDSDEVDNNVKDLTLAVNHEQTDHFCADRNQKLHQCD